MVKRLTPKIDCFAYDDKKKECICLKELVCSKSDKCTFYKHKSKVDWNEIKKAVRNYSGPGK